ncbi:MAG: glycosyltransferase family 39 protein [Deltaproteobacteria bacterium]|nr:glycosyltransferase family 39 protein [Deltaproteobacteria bacterium]
MKAEARELPAGRPRDGIGNAAEVGMDAAAGTLRRVPVPFLGGVARLAKLGRGQLPVALATLVFLLPFVNKAFHIDDTLFLWVARHIQSHPLDFYGFQATWYKSAMPMAQINQNPPLVSYYSALVTLLFGWREWVLHLAFLVPALGVSLGTYQLAKRFCARPGVAAMTAVATPVFLVSATNVMSDVLMVAFYVWAVVLWVRGLEDRRLWSLVGASALIALSALTKYFGLAAIPLLAAYTLARDRGLNRRSAVLLLLLGPILVLAAYQAWTVSMYGRGLVSGAATYALTRTAGVGGDLAGRVASGLSFTGGCVASALFFAPYLWARRAWLLGGGVLGLLVVAALAARGSLLGLEFAEDGVYRWGLLLQLALFITAGLHVLFLAAAELWEKRDAPAVLLFCWTAGTFCFATLLNWTINGRTVLPMVPAVGILVARRWERRAPTRPMFAPHFALWPAAALALGVTWADYALAGTQRQAVQSISNHLRPHGRRIWFQGHWGFQYYMEQTGARIADWKNSVLQPGDFLVLAGTNCDGYPVDASFELVGEYSFGATRWVTTMHWPPVGAGFYASVFGPLPYVFGEIPTEKYWLFTKLEGS